MSHPKYGCQRPFEADVVTLSPAARRGPRAYNYTPACMSRKEDPFAQWDMALDIGDLPSRNRRDNRSAWGSLADSLWLLHLPEDQVVLRGAPDGRLRGVGARLCSVAIRALKRHITNAVYRTMTADADVRDQRRARVSEEDTRG